MLVRVHKNRSLDRNSRPCRCWIVLAAPHYVQLGSCEMIVLRNVVLHTTETSGWAVGELVRTEELRLTGRNQELCRMALRAEGAECDAPEDGWEMIRYSVDEGFTCRGTRVDHVRWMRLTPWSDAVVCDETPPAR